MLVEAFIQLAPTALLVGAVGTVLLALSLRIRDHYKLAKLGRPTKHVPSWFPYLGFDLIYSAVQRARVNMNYEGWKQRCLQTGYTFDMTLLFKRVVFTAEPENMKAILTSQFLDFGKGPKFYKLWSPFLGDSIFTTDGEKWHDSRQLIRPQFVKDRVSDLHTFERHVQKVISIIKGSNGAPVNIMDLMFRLTLDAATDFLLGESIDSLTTPQISFAEAFAEIQRLQNDLERLGPLNWTMPRGEYKKHLKTLNSFVYPYVEKTIRMSPEELKSKGEKDYNFLHALAEFTQDRKVLRDQLVAVLLAARDTTAGTMSWLFYELSRHPEYIKPLRQEILETVGPTAAPTYNHLKSMKFLQALLNETLRLYPAVPFNVRTALKDTTLPCGGGPSGTEPIAVLKGTPVAYSTIIMQRRTDLYGPDAEEFKPERWINWTPKSWHYVPFNGGPRICIGQQFALTEMSYTFVRIFQAFESIGAISDKPILMKTEITVSPAEPILVTFREARP